MEAPSTKSATAGSKTTGGRQIWRSASALFAPALSGALLGLSFRSADLRALVWIGLVPFCSALLKSQVDLRDLHRKLFRRRRI